VQHKAEFALWAHRRNHIQEKATPGRFHNRRLVFRSRSRARVATEALAEFVSALKQQEGRLVLAWVKDRASESLMRARLIADQDALASVHWSFDDAVPATRAK